ncbi:MAG: hypothetical protein ACREX8_05825 [Gammaproteobacteria bacterium]
MLDLTRSWKYFAAFFALALVAFWPTYLSRPGASNSYTHLHAATAALWMLLLVAQSWAIGSRRVALHRLYGKGSYVLAPVLLVSILLLAHDRIRGVGGEAYAIQTYILYLQLSLAALFALSYGLAIWNRRSVALHSRFMVCTALTLVDPVVIRLMFWADPTPEWNYQWLTFGLTDLVLLVLIWLERNNRAGRGVFPAMLAIFVLAQLPALLGLTEGPLWQGFARWYAAL